MATKTKPKPARKPPAKKPAAKAAPKKKTKPKAGDPVVAAVGVLAGLRNDLLLVGDFVRADAVKRASRELTR